MAFGLIRARNLSAGDIVSTDTHNARRYEKIEDYPKNVDLEKRNDNYINVEYTAKSIDHSYLTKGQSDLGIMINERLTKNEVKGIKKNSNIAIEYVIGINDKSAWDHYSFDGFVSNTKKWLEDRHGKDSVVAVYKHLDESNPHAHIIIVPIEKKTIKWKNTKGEGEKIENRLNTRDYTGGREKLRDLQTGYFEHLNQRYSGGQKFGLKLYRGTLVENQTREYVENTNYEIGVLKATQEQAKTEHEKAILQVQITQKNRLLLEKEIELKKEEDRRSSQRKGLWKVKGTQDNQDIFHSKTERENASRKKGRGMK